jgi:hypothetical protein
VAGSAFLIAGSMSPSVGALGVFLLVIGFAFPSRQMVQNRLNEQHRKAVGDELDRRLSHFNRFTERQETGVDRSRQTVELIEKLELTDEDLPWGTLERLRAQVALAELQDEVRREGRLPIIPGHERVLESDICFFVAPAVYDERGDNDPSGTLYLSQTNATFAASESFVAVPWSKVVSISLEDRALHIQRRDRQTSTDFILGLADALRAEYVAQQLLEKSPLVPSTPPSSTSATQTRATTRVAAEVSTSTPIAQTSSERSTEVIGTTIDLSHGGGAFSVGVVGQSYCQLALKAFAGGRRERGEHVFF